MGTMAGARTLGQLIRAHVEGRVVGLQGLFHRGCGFTGFLQQLFLLLTFEEMLGARGVCRCWRDFIDTQVWHLHPSITWLLKEFPEAQAGGGGLAGTLKYLRILSLRSSYPPLRMKRLQR